MDHPTTLRPRRTARRLAAAALLLACGAPTAARAQAPATEVRSAAAPRTRVGLALGGGAARGFAHLGVLKWFEDHHIPVDVIGGTSMGGLMAGAYATGMSSADIRALIGTIDWAHMLGPDAPFDSKTFRRREDKRAFPSDLSFGLKDGFALPGGLSPGAQIDLLFDRIAAPYPTSMNFNDFPTPFRCVAADLRTASAVVFDAGWLARALRSTMAIPGVFSPVRVEGKVLVDGGVVNNVPADVVKDTGLADVVIAVDVSADLARERRYDSLFNVLNETLDVMTRAAATRALASATLTIVPDLLGLVATDFGRAEEFTRRGYAAAEKRAAELTPYAVSEADYAAWKAARDARRRTAVPVPAFVVVEGVLPREAVGIRKQLSSHVGRPFSPASLEHDLTNLTGGGRYESATYRFDTRDGRQGLFVTLREKPYGPPFLLVSLDLQNTESSNVSATVRARIVSLGALGHGSEGRFDFAVGNTLGASAELYRPIGPTGFFVAPRASTARHDTALFQNNAYTAEYRVQRNTIGGDVGYTTAHHFEARAGYTWEYLRADTRIGTDLLPKVNGHQDYALLSAVYDDQDSPTVPTHGTYWRSQVRRFFSAPGLTLPAGVSLVERDDLWSGETQASWFQPVSRRGRVFLRGEGGSSFGQTTAVRAFTLGGPFRLSGFYQDELRGSNFAVASAGYFHELMRVAEGAMGRLYFCSWLEVGSAFERARDAKAHGSGTAGLIMESPIGPLFAGASLGDGRRWRGYVGIGPVMGR
jgi:NTE family protein